MYAVKEDLKEALIVPLPNVCDRTLRKVLVYCTHHTNCGEAETPDIDKEIQSWDVKYMSVREVLLPARCITASQSITN